MTRLDKKKTKKEIIEEEERKLWCDIAIAVSGAEDCKDNTIARKWADSIADRFRERYLYSD